jgi:DNA-binding beta-propeller fold protein YncE
MFVPLLTCAPASTRPSVVVPFALTSGSVRSSPEFRSSSSLTTDASPPPGGPTLTTRYTLDVQNGTLMSGNRKLANQHPYEPFYVAYDPALNRLYLSSGCEIDVLNPSTLSYLSSLTASAGCGVIYLPATQSLYLSAPSHVAVVDPATDTVTQRIYAPEAGQTTYGLFVYDASANAILVGNAFNDTVNVVSLILDRVVANISVGYDVVDGAYDPVNSNVYLAGYENNTVEEVNSQTWSLRYLKLPSSMFGFLQGVAVDGQSGNVYATSVFYCPGCYGYDDIVELSGQTGNVLAYRGIGSYTTGMAYDSSTDRLFVADSVAGQVYVLYPNNLSTSETIFTDTPALGLYGAWWLTYVPELNTIYAPTSFQDSLIAISDVTLSIYLSWGGFAQPYAEVWDGGCECLVLGDWWEDKLYFVNETSYQIVRSIPLGGTVRGVTYDSATNELWVGMGDLWGSSGIAILNATNGHRVTTLSSGSWFNAPTFDSADERMYVPSVLGNAVDIYNSTNLTYLGKVSALDATNAAWDPVNDRVFISDWEANNVTVINGRSGSLVTTILNVSGPNAIVYDPSTSRVYTGDENSPNITAIDSISDKIAGNISFPPYAAGLAISPSGKNLFVTSDNAEVTDLNLTTNRSVGIAAGTETAGMAWLPDGVLAATDLNGGVYFLSTGGPDPLTTPSLELNPSYVVKGAPVTISTDVNGGSGSYRYSYSNLPSGCSSANSASFVCAPTQLGQFDVEVSVTDSGSQSLNASAYLWVASGYVVTFFATGLPAGQEWWVNLTDGQSFNSTEPAITFNELDGTYTYWIAAADRTYSAPGGSFSVIGSAVAESVGFSRVFYAVTFNEVGLPVGTEWWANVTGQPPEGLTSIQLAIELLNGSYTYSVATVNKIYEATGGAFTVNGGQGTVSVMFTRVTYDVTFAEQGLPAGEAWSVTFNGTEFRASSASISFVVTNGSSTFSIGPVSGYSSNLTSGYVKVAGSSQSIAVSFVSAIGGGGGLSSGGVSPMEWGPIGAAIAIAIAVGLAVGYRRRRTGAIRIQSHRGPNPPNLPPPQT